MSENKLLLHDECLVHVKKKVTLIEEEAGMALT